VADEAAERNQAAYDQIAGLYAARQAGRGRSCADLRAAFTACLPEVADVADLGCGPAGDGALLARAGHRVTGIDRSAAMLAYAARALPGRVLQADLRRLPLAGQSTDGIWCCAALLHVPHDQTMAALGEMRRILRPGGWLALVTAAGRGARLEPVPYAPRIARREPTSESAAYSVGTGRSQVSGQTCRARKRQPSCMKPGSSCVNRGETIAEPFPLRAVRCGWIWLPAVRFRRAARIRP
jgi:SAM-dependent methyltransferase